MGFVPACLANRGQYLSRNPLFELLRFGLAAGEDQAVEARFVDEVDFLFCVKFLIYQSVGNTDGVIFQ